MVTQKRTLWTPSSWECFKNNCTCSKECSNYDLCQSIAKKTKDKKPPIKKAVLDLIENGVAIPLAVTGTKGDFMSLEHSTALYLWIVGGLTDKEIASRMNTTEKAIQEKKSIILRGFNYSYPHNRGNQVKNFREWAKADLIPELEELKKVGVVC